MYESNWGHEIAFAFIVACMLSQYIKTYCKTLWTIEIAIHTCTHDYMIILYDYMKLSILVTEMLCSIYTKFTKVTSNVVHPMYNTFSSLSMSTTLVYVN